MDRFKKYLESLSYKNWSFTLLEENGVVFLQISFVKDCACRKDVGPLVHYCRKWRISERSTKSEFIQTAFSAVMFAEEHEVREAFKYKGAAVYGPHFSVDRLVDIYEEGGFDMRTNSFLEEK